MSTIRNIKLIDRNGSVQTADTMQTGKEFEEEHEYLGNINIIHPILSSSFKQHNKKDL